MKRLLPIALAFIAFISTVIAECPLTVCECWCVFEVDAGDVVELRVSKVVLEPFLFTTRLPACAKACGATLGGLTYCDFNCTKDFGEGWCCVKGLLNCSGRYLEEMCDYCEPADIKYCRYWFRIPGESLFLPGESRLVLEGYLETCPKTCEAKQYIRETTLMLQSIALLAGAVAIILCAMVLMFSASPERREKVKKMIFYIILALILMAIATPLVRYLLERVIA